MLRNLRSQKTLARNIEWMTNSVERSRGLLKYKEAPQDYVAIFKLPLNGFFPLIHCVGMKFPIDIVFCSSNKIVRSVFKSVKPGRFVLPWAYLLGGCKYLLEFSVSDTSDIVLGDQLEWGDSPA